MSDLMVQQIDGGVVFTAKIVPASSKTALCGLFDGMLKFKISAAPQKGKANQRLIEFISGRLGVAKKDVSIISGLTKPIKQVQVLGISPDMLLNKLDLNQ